VTFDGSPNVFVLGGIATLKKPGGGLYATTWWRSWGSSPYDGKKFMKGSNEGLAKTDETKK